MEIEILKRTLDIERTLINYRKVAWFYDFWSRLTESKAANQVIEVAEISDGETVLEVACGTGIVFEQIVHLNPTGKNVGIDLSPDMLNKAKKKLEDTQMTNYELNEGNVLNLNFQDNSFDLVVNNYMVDLMPIETFNKIASEFYRVTKPNGRVVVSTFSFGNKKINKLWYWIAKLFPDLLTGCRPVSFSQYLRDAGFIFEKKIEVSQNSFPSEVIKVRKSD